MEPRETGDSEAVQKAMNSLEPLDVAAAEGVLREAKEIMDELGVVFFLRQGTCLGAVRDNAILAWDDDIDIGSIIGLHGLTTDSVNGVVDRVVATFTERGFSTKVEQTSNFTYVLLLNRPLVRLDPGNRFQQALERGYEVETVFEAEIDTGLPPVPLYRRK